MKNNLELHDAHVLEQCFFLANDLSDIKPLTESRARQWLQRPIWSRQEAILILSGSDPESRRYYDVDGFKSLPTSANGAVDWYPARTLKSVLPIGDERPHGEYLAWANEEHLKWEGDNQVRYSRLTLPAALHAALVPADTNETSTATEPAEALPVSLVAQTSNPEPVTTLDIAFAFEGLRNWSEGNWKRSLGNKPKWLAACIAIPGKQGVYQTKWNPVSIGVALINQGHAKVNNVRARFQKKAPLMPWLEVWKTYEADYLESK